MSFYQVDSSRLRAKKDELLNMIQRFRQEKEALCQKEVSLRTMWEGAANDSFHNAFEKNAGQMDAFIETILRYVNTIESIAQRYDMAEQKNMGRCV